MQLPPMQLRSLHLGGVRWRGAPTWPIYVLSKHAALQIEVLVCGVRGTADVVNRVRHQAIVLEYGAREGSEAKLHEGHGRGMERAVSSTAGTEHRG